MSRNERTAGRIALEAPRLLILVAVTYLVIAWTAVILVDLLGSQPVVPMWIRIFRERGPTGVLQWTALLAAVAICLRGARRWEASTDLNRFLTLMAVATTMMFGEDVANFSHLAGAVFGPDPTGFRVGRLIVYIVIAAVPTWALVRYWSHLGGGRGRLLVGYGLYAVAAGASVPANLLGFYERLGPWLLSSVFRDRLRRLPDGAAPFPEYDVTDQTGIVFVDFAIEESLELLGAAFLLAALIAIAHRRPHLSDANPGSAPAGNRP